MSLVPPFAADETEPDPHELASQLAAAVTELTEFCTDWIERNRGPFFMLRMSPLGVTVDRPEDVDGGGQLLEQLGLEPARAEAAMAIDDASMLLAGLGPFRVLHDGDPPPCELKPCDPKVRESFLALIMREHQFPSLVVARRDEMTTVVTYRLAQRLLSEDRLDLEVLNGAAERHVLHETGDVVYGVPIDQEPSGGYRMDI